MLFNETAGNFIIEVDQIALEHPLFKQLDYVKLGTTIADPKIIVYSPPPGGAQAHGSIHFCCAKTLTTSESESNSNVARPECCSKNSVSKDSDQIISITIEKLRSAWQRPLKEVFNS